MVQFGNLYHPWKFLICFVSRYTLAVALILYSCASADNYDSISAKKWDIGTLNMFLLYIIFTNDLPLFGNWVIVVNGLRNVIL